MSQSTGFDVAHLDETRFKGQDVGIRQGETLWLTFPIDLPVRSGSPTVAIDEEGEVGIVEQKLAVQPLDVDRLEVLLACDEIQRGIGLVEQ